MYRFRTWLRGIPGLWWIPKGDNCGCHEWYIEDWLDQHSVRMACYHCKVTKITTVAYEDFGEHT